MTGIGENTLAQPVKPPLRKRRACLAKLVKNRLTLTSAEVGDFTRFRSGRQVTAYFGLAPSQRSSGDSVRLGGISGAGNALVRKLAVEGSWCYAAARHQPKLMPRDTGVPLEIRMHGRKGSERLLRRREEMLARGMPAAKANAATAAELVRWLWALGMMCREGAE